MKAHEALIAWSGMNDPGPTRGKVEIGYLPEDQDTPDWSGPYASTGGAAFVARRELRGAESLVRLFKDFQYLVVEERLDPDAVHKAFLAIDEYAALFDAQRL